MRQAETMCLAYRQYVTPAKAPPYGCPPALPEGY